ncbi:CD44 antigen-like isoform X2 [Osmerus mordax]|uniref:CD44 antigen-like isoform X2 n=1 Tax=Osmerus mordax TaxID=8014 RepID=UPI0035100503
MWTLLLGVTFGFLASSNSEPAQVKSRSCSHAKVFHVEGADRYALTFDLAKELCESLNATLASKEQITEAYQEDLETCRYGWISNQNTTILRHKAHPNCANNSTGVVFLQFTPDNLFDAYCYDAKADPKKNCDQAINQDSTGPDSLDGVEELLASDAADDTTQQPGDLEDEEKEYIQTQTPDLEDMEKEYIQTQTPDLEDMEKEYIQTQTPDLEDHPEAEPTSQPEDSHEVHLKDAGADPALDSQNTTLTPETETEDGITTPETVPAFKGEEDLAVPASTDAGPDASVEEGQTEGASTASPVGEEEQAGGNDTQGASPTGEPGLTLEDTTGSGMLPPTSEEENTITVTHVEKPAGPPEPTIEGESMEVKVEDMEKKVKAEAKEEVAAQPNTKAGRKGPGVGPAPTAAGQQGGSNWVVVIGVIVAVGAILLVCAAIAKRKSLCGKQQSLMISSKDGSEGNGAASLVAGSRAQEREQEMVTLMNKEKIQENGNTEEFTVITLEESPEKEQLA